MQINFTPQKIKAAKAYIENLDSFSVDKREKKIKQKTSFFEKIKKLFFSA